MMRCPKCGTIYPYPYDDIFIHYCVENSCRFPDASGKKIGIMALEDMSPAEVLIESVRPEKNK